MDHEDYLDEQLFDDDELIPEDLEPTGLEAPAEGENEALKSVWKTSENTVQKKSRAISSKPRPKLTEREMVSQKGLPALLSLFDNYKPSNKLTPYDNMNDILNKMEYWAHGLFPQLLFEDFLEKAEHIGRKRLVRLSMQKLRLGMSLQDDFDNQNEKKEENQPLEKQKTAEELFDEQFDDFYDDDFPVESLSVPPNKAPSFNENKAESDQEMSDAEFEAQLKNIFGTRKEDVNSKASSPEIKSPTKSPEKPIEHKRGIVESDSEGEQNVTPNEIESPNESPQPKKRGRLNAEFWSDED